jgi:hypothetical protein
MQWIAKDQGLEYLGAGGFGARYTFRFMCMSCPVVSTRVCVSVSNANTRSVCESDLSITTAAQSTPRRCELMMQGMDEHQQKENEDNET